MSAQRGVMLDVKVFSVVEFGADPWVNIWSGATFVAEMDWRPQMDSPSFDALAREAVLHACLILGDERIPLTPKSAAWLVSALLAVRHRYAPATRHDALSELHRVEPQEL